ncbi:MAG: RidA family protein [Candidatus Symbiothrix sp.]|jgi:2-iminobutanoate/2-iminopropanoate deaminase|nr:RidA family protein [Candidatus Symbiothrix sp.]
MQKYLNNIYLCRMEKQQITSTHAPAAIGPYSQAIRTGNFVFLSGQLGIDPATGNFVEGGVTEQTEQVFKNIKAVLSEAGLNLDNVVKTTVFLSDMQDFASMNTVYENHFTDPYPARSAVAVKTLPKNGLVEIEVIVSG